MNVEVCSLLGLGILGIALGWGMGVYMLRIKNRKLKG